MKEKEILETIKTLSSSQGFYGRLYESLMQAKETKPEAYRELMNSWEAKNFADATDFVMYIEG